MSSEINDLIALCHIALDGNQAWSASDLYLNFHRPIIINYIWNKVYNLLTSELRLDRVDLLDYSDVKANFMPYNRCSCGRFHDLPGSEYMPGTTLTYSRFMRALMVPRAFSTLMKHKKLSNQFIKELEWTLTSSDPLGYVTSLSQYIYQGWRDVYSNCEERRFKERRVKYLQRKYARKWLKETELIRGVAVEEPILLLKYYRWPPLAD